MIVIIAAGVLSHREPKIECAEQKPIEGNLSWSISNTKMKTVLTAKALSAVTIHAAVPYLFDTQTIREIYGTVNATQPSFQIGLGNLGFDDAVGLLVKGDAIASDGKNEASFAQFGTAGDPLGIAFITGHYSAFVAKDEQYVSSTVQYRTSGDRIMSALAIGSLVDMQSSSNQFLDRINPSASFGLYFEEHEFFLGLRAHVHPSIGARGAKLTPKLNNFNDLQLIQSIAGRLDCQLKKRKLVAKGIFLC